MIVYKISENSIKNIIQLINPRLGRSNDNNGISHLKAAVTIGDFRLRATRDSRNENVLLELNISKCFAAMQRLLRDEKLGCLSGTVRQGMHRDGGTRLWSMART